MLQSMSPVVANQPIRRASNESNKISVDSPQTQTFVGEPLLETPKSITCSESDFGCEENPETPTIIRRPSNSNSSVSSSVGRASQIVDAVTETVQEVTWTWTQFLIKWAPTILLVFLCIPCFYFYRMAVEDVMYTISRLRDTAIHQFDATVADIHSRQNHRTFNADMKLNFTARMQPFWGEYAELLKNTDYEHWFANARDADDAITAMYNGLPPATGNETMQRTRIKGFIDLRSTQRKKAEVFFENFLNARLVVIETMLYESRTFRAWLRWKLMNGNLPPKTIVTEYAVEFSTSGKHNMTSYILNHGAAVFMDRLITAHTRFYASETSSETHRSVTPFDQSILSLESRLHSLLAVELAEETENHCIKYLRQNSAYAEVWKSHHSSSMRRLKRKLLGLQRRLRKIQARMNWLEARFESEVEFENDRTTDAVLQSRPERLVWVEDVDSLVNSLEDAYTPLVEAHVWAQSRQDALRADLKSSDYEKNWQQWKKNNCGFASCYIEAPNATIRKLLWHAQNGLGFGSTPLAKRPVGLDDNNDNALWEKICCGDSKHNEWIELLEYSKEMTYQNPHREQQALGEAAAEELGDDDFNEPYA